jgi:hypothetical protein
MAEPIRLEAGQLAFCAAAPEQEATVPSAALRPGGRAMVSCSGNCSPSWRLTVVVKEVERPARASVLPPVKAGANGGGPAQGPPLGAATLTDPVQSTAGLPL